MSNDEWFWNRIIIDYWYITIVHNTTNTDIIHYSLLIINQLFSEFMLFDKIEKFGLGSVISRFLRIRSLTVSRKSESFFFSGESRLWKCIEFILKSWIIYIQTRHFSIQSITRKDISDIARSLLGTWPKRICPCSRLRPMKHRSISAIEKKNIRIHISIHLRPSDQKQENNDRKYRS